MKGKMIWGLPGMFGIGLVLWQLTPIQGIMGHDFYHYFARVYVGAIHFWQNGLAVPHYTASLCGGLPIFADPQSMYYSVPQWLTFVLDPLVAVLLTHGIFYGVGYWGFYRLLREAMEASVELSHWGALAFILNGFSFEHLLVGHLTHHSYLLFPWLLYFALSDGLAFWRRVGLFSLVVIYTFYSGGTHMIVVFVGGGLLLLPWWIDRQVTRGKLRETGVFLLVSTGLVLAACAPKLAASAALSPSFLQRPIDSSGLSISMLLAQFFWFNPRTVPMSIPFGHWNFGPWEYVGFVSRIFVLGVPLLLVMYLRRFTTRKAVVVMSYIGVAYLIAWVGAAKHAEHGLPLLRDYHNPIKLYGAFIPFLILAAVAAARRIGAVPGFFPTTPWVRVTLFGLAALLVVGEFKRGSDYFVSSRLVYGFKYFPDTYRQLKQAGTLPPVTKVTDNYGADVQGIAQGSTSLKCFEPMFGYRREVMKASVIPGDTAAVRDGRYNLTHPGCLVYPGHFGCQRWDRIPVHEAAAFTEFIRGESGAWGVPMWQTGLLRLGFVAFLSSLALALGAGAWVERWRKRHEAVA